VNAVPKALDINFAAIYLEPDEVQ